MALTELEVKNAKAEDKLRKFSNGLGMYLLTQLIGSKLWHLKYRFGGMEKLHRRVQEEGCHSTPCPN